MIQESFLNPLPESIQIAGSLNDPAIYFLSRTDSKQLPETDGFGHSSPYLRNFTQSAEGSKGSGAKFLNLPIN